MKTRVASSTLKKNHQTGFILVTNSSGGCEVSWKMPRLHRWLDGHGIPKHLLHYLFFYVLTWPELSILEVYFSVFCCCFLLQLFYYFECYPRLARLKWKCWQGWWIDVWSACKYSSGGGSSEHHYCQWLFSETIFNIFLEHTLKLHCETLNSKSKLMKLIIFRLQGTGLRMHRDCKLWPDVCPTLMMSSLLPGCHPGAAAEWQRSSTNDGSLIRSASSAYYYAAVLLPWRLEEGAERDLPRLCPLVLGHSTPVPISANQCQCKLAGLYIIIQGPLSPVANLHTVPVTFDWSCQALNDKPRWYKQICILMVFFCCRSNKVCRLSYPGHQLYFFDFVLVGTTENVQKNDRDETSCVYRNHL